jgi:apolipoprotein N-acyltransferase
MTPDSIDGSPSEPISNQGPSNTVQWLVVAAVLLLFANGRHTVAAAAWLAPVFLLRFTRSRRPRGGLLVAWIVLAATWAFQLRGMAPLPGIWYYVVAAVFGLVGTFPYAADRWMAPRIGGFRSTLVLPCAWVVAEYLTTAFTPYGSWGSYAYTQHENLALIQLLSVTGIYGVSFLIAWFAAVANWAWEHDFSVATVGRGALAFTAVIAIVLFGGGLRLVLFAPDSETVRVASLTRPDIDLFGSEEATQRAYAGTATDEDLQLIRTHGDSINDDLLARTEREARAGAKIVFWGEGNGFTLKADEAALIQRSADVARRNGIYLGLGMAAWNLDNPKPLENKLVLIDPRGDVVWEYWKAIPVPGGEAAMMARDDGRIKSVETPHGTVAAAICYDMDFPDLLSQAGDLGADLLIVPSNDWREIDPWHSHMARFRAIEQGFNMVRHVSGGLSIATDYQGRVLAAMDHYTTTDRDMISHVPTRGVWTIYSAIGDTFAWLCIVGLVVFVALRNRRKTPAAV